MLCNRLETLVATFPLVIPIIVVTIVTALNSIITTIIVTTISILHIVVLVPTATNVLSILIINITGSSSNRRPSILTFSLLLLSSFLMSACLMDLEDLPRAISTNFLKNKKIQQRSFHGINYNNLKTDDGHSSNDHQNSRDADGNRNENNTTMSITTSTDWCRVDTGYYTIAMVNGSKQDAYLSYRRDGSVWIRVGQDSTEDWKFREETRAKFKVTLLSQELMNFIEQLNYTDQCVLSDLNFNIRINSGLRPFHLDVYLPSLRQNRVILSRHNRTCGMSTTLTLTSNKQAFSCDGTPGNKNACGRRYLPEVGQTTLPLFIKSINFDSTFVGNYDQSCTQQFQNQQQSPEHQQPSSSLENQHSSHKPSQHHLLQQNDQLNQNIDRHFMYQQRKQQNKLVNNYHHYQHKQQHYHEFQHPFNYITLEGSYYVAYLKVAQCQPARGCCINNCSNQAK